MAYAIIWDDAPGAEAQRAALRADHIAYVRQNLDRIVISGGILSDDGGTACGGLMVLDTDSRAEAEAFVAADPFYRGGVYRDCRILRWRKAFVAGQDFLGASG